jgi:hypothetical protein
VKLRPIAPIRADPRQIITPINVRPSDRPFDHERSGYAIHNGSARSMEDVTVRHGTAPIIERGQADDDELEETLAAIELDSGGAPD